MKLTLAAGDRRLLHQAAKDWGPKLRRLYSGFAGSGYRAEAQQMLRDAELLQGDDHSAGIVDRLQEQASLFEEGGSSAVINATKREQRVLWYGLRAHRKDVERAKARDEEFGYDVAQHDADLARIGVYEVDAEGSGVGVGGWLEKLDGGYEAREPIVDPSQKEIDGSE